MSVRLRAILILAASLLIAKPAFALTLFSVDASSNVNYGESITIDVAYMGSGVLKIVNKETGATVKSLVLPEGVPEKSFKVDTTGMFPGEYYLVILDEGGNEKYNSITSKNPVLFTGTIRVQSSVKQTPTLPIKTPTLQTPEYTPTPIQPKQRYISIRGLVLTFDVIDNAFKKSNS